MNVMGNDAFLEVMGDLALRIWILDKMPAMMEEALQIVLSL